MSEVKQTMAGKTQCNRTWNIVKNVLLALVFLGLAGAVIGLSIKVNRTTSERLGGEAYSIGILDAGGEAKEGETAICTRKGVSVSGLKCELKKDAKIKYQIFFYGQDGKFISASEELTEDYDGSGVPEEAKTAKIMITPLADEDGKVSLVEVLGYANQLIVSYEK